MFLIVTASVTSDGTLSLMVLAASSDSKTTMLNPPSSPRVQYPATNPGACDTPGTTFSRNWLVAASRSLTVTVTTTACMGVSFCRWLARTLSGSQRDDRLTAVGTSPAQYLASASRVRDQPEPNWGTGPLLAGLGFTLVRGLPDLEVPALKRGQDADSGFLRVWSCEAGHQATVFSCDVFNPVQRQQASCSGSVTCDGDKVVGHAMGTLLLPPGGFEGLGSARILLHPPDLSVLETDHPKERCVNPGLCVAALQAASRDPFDRHDAISGIDHLIGFDPVFGIQVGQRVEESRDLLGPPENPGARNELKFYFCVPDLGKGRPVPRSPRGDLSLHDLDVLLRHRPRSISRRVP